MIKSIATCFLAGICVCTALHMAVAGSTIIWNSEGMRRVKQSGKFQAAIKKQILRADKYLNIKPPSVMDKKITPPSGNKHDYMTWAIYWWPDPKKPDGKPYIRRDGHINPEDYNDKTDGAAMKILFDSVPKLALAYYYTGQGKYAQKTAEILRAWFVNPKTAMNPNMNFAQGIPGRSTGRCFGIIAFSLRIHFLLDSLIMISESKYWTLADDKAMNKWLTDYKHWLQTSSLALKAARAANNHSTWFAEQLAYIQLYQGHKKSALKTVETQFKTHFNSHFTPEGAQPLELKRTRSIDYSVMNLSGWFNLCRIAELSGKNLWEYQGRNGATLRKAADYMTKVVDGTWSHKEIRKLKPDYTLEILIRGYNAYQDKKLLNTIHKIPEKLVRESLVQLTFPLK